MSINRFVCRLLRLKGLRVGWVEFSQWNRELHLGVKPYKNGCLCPQCERRGEIVHQLPEQRVWRDV